MTVLCLVEIADGGLRDASKRALGVARGLAGSAGEEAAAVWVGPAEAISRSELGAAGVSVGYAISLGDGVGYAPVAWARGLAGLAGAPGSAGSADVAGSHESAGLVDSAGSRESAGLVDSAGPVSAVVAAATDRGNEVLAHLAAITGLPMAANCVSAVRSRSDQTDLVRQRWAGSLLEEATLDSPLALLTVAADAVAQPEASPAGAAGVAEMAGVTGVIGTAGVAGVTGLAETTHPVVHVYQPDLAEADLLVQATESADRRSGVSLATARVVVGGGRGVGGPDGFSVLEELADLLGGALGVSRVVTSQGWRPHRQQVGQTGTKISPELYLACGISGAIQHMAGCQGAKTIVAINTDPDAPIIAKANYAVIGDLHEVLPALIAALKSADEDG
ncbi:MAG TPA: electron transfer flavoprotein subunit alpha/FixB family protein [Streptosporangiaceae bacterium]|jgi:electron transfer flavoprotein alpha subunit